MIIARLIADPAGLADSLAAARVRLEAQGWPIALAEMLEFCSNVLQLELAEGDPAQVRAILDQCFPGADMLVSDRPITVPALLVSDMDSTMISAECIDELADFAGLKAEVAAITERAMAGELDFAGALHERVGLLAGLDETAIAACLAERIEPMPGARALIATLKSRGCHTVLVTGGFHAFADPVAEQLGFDRVVANRLAVADGKLSGTVAGAIVDSAVKARTLAEEAARLGDNAATMALGDGANDIPMLQAANWGIAYHAKPKARAAAAGWIDRGDLGAVLDLLGVDRADWVYGAAAQ